jgi:ABC-type sugar transport system ATPase subunit
MADVAHQMETGQGTAKRFSRAILEARGLQKQYGPVHAVRDVGLTLHAGEALALCGENGAGKSTIFKILAGEVAPDGGEITLNGDPFKPDSAASAVRAGVSMVYQEFNTLPNTSVAENVFLGRMDMFRRFGIIDWKKLHAAAEEVLNRLGLKIDPRASMASLSPSTCKMIELARALSTNPKVLLLDEITASLDHDDADTLHRLMADLRAQGVGILYVSHRLQEIFGSCTTVEVMKDGAYVTTRPVEDLDESQLSALMIGRKIDVWERTPGLGDRPVMLALDGLSGVGFKDVSLKVRRGQIVTLAGLAGSGADAVLEAVFGAAAVSKGSIELDGKKHEGRDIPAAIAAGIAMVPKERAVEGLIDSADIQFNIGLAGLTRNARGGFVDGGAESKDAEQGMQLFRIKAPSTATAVRNLSGGNKQKVLLAKWFLTNPKLILLNNPTRGVDVGVKLEIYEMLQKLREERELAVLMASEDMAEVIRVSDVVITIRHGAISGVFEGEAITETNLINAMI